MRVAVFGNGVAEEKPVKRGIVGRKKRLQIVDDLLDDGAQFECGEVALAGCKRVRLRFELIQSWRIFSIR